MASLKEEAIPSSKREEIQIAYKKIAFYCKGGEALAQVAQRGGGCPIPGDTQGQAGRGSEHLMELQVSLFIAEELDQMAFKDPFQLKPLCDSIRGGKGCAQAQFSPRDIQVLHEQMFPCPAERTGDSWGAGGWKWQCLTAVHCKESISKKPCRRTKDFICRCCQAPYLPK